jgi:hypothetical protein
VPAREEGADAACVAWVGFLCLLPVSVSGNDVAERCLFGFGRRRRTQSTLLYTYCSRSVLL